MFVIQCHIDLGTWSVPHKRKTPYYHVQVQLHFCKKYLMKRKSSFSLTLKYYFTHPLKLILRFNHKFIWRLLTMFRIQMFVECKMKNRFIVNIWNMHAWLNATASSNDCLPSSSYVHTCSKFSDTSRPLKHTMLSVKGGLTVKEGILCLGWQQRGSSI